MNYSQKANPNATNSELDAIDEIPEDVLYQTEHWKIYEQLKGVKS